VYVHIHSTYVYASKTSIDDRSRHDQVSFDRDCLLALGLLSEQQGVRTLTTTRHTSTHLQRAYIFQPCMRSMCLRCCLCSQRCRCSPSPRCFLPASRNGSDNSCTLRRLRTQTGHPCQHQQSAGESLGVVIHECVSMCEGERGREGDQGGKRCFFPLLLRVCVSRVSVRDSERGREEEIIHLSIYPSIHQSIYYLSIYSIHTHTHTCIHTHPRSLSRYPTGQPARNQWIDR